MSVRKLTAFLFLASLTAVAVMESSDLYASSYYNTFVLSRSGEPQGSSIGSALPLPPVISTSTRALFSSASSTVRARAYASTSAELISYLGKLGVKIDLSSRNATTSKVSITSLSKYDAAPGDLIRITGKGFDKVTNTVYFNDKKVENISSIFGTSLVVKVPLDMYGSLKVRVGTKEGTSNAFPLRVTKKGAKAPVISFAGRKVDLSTKITLNGTGIAKTNEVRTTLGTLYNVASDSTKSLTFSFGDMPGLASYKKLPKDSASTTVMFWVSNENGTSNIVGPINISLSL